MDNSISDITFDNTIDWANKTTAKPINENGIPLFYLFIGAFVMLVLIILVLSGTKREDLNELDMIVDEEYQQDDQDNDQDGEQDDIQNDN